MQMFDKQHIARKARWPRAWFMTNAPLKTLKFKSICPLSAEFILLELRLGIKTTGQKKRKAWCEPSFSLFSYSVDRRSLRLASCDSQLFFFFLRNDNPRRDGEHQRFGIATDRVVLEQSVDIRNLREDRSSFFDTFF